MIAFPRVPSGRAQRTTGQQMASMARMKFSNFGVGQCLVIGRSAYLKPMVPM